MKISLQSSEQIHLVILNHLHALCAVILGGGLTLKVPVTTIDARQHFETG